MEIILFVSAYTMAQQYTSATGIAAICRYKRTMCTLIALEEYCLSEQSGNATNNISVIAANAIVRCYLAHSRHFRKIIVIVESNSCADNAASICIKINKLLKVIKDVEVKFCHYKLQRGLCHQNHSVNIYGTDTKLGFYLGKQKQSFF